MIYQDMTLLPTWMEMELEHILTTLRDRRRGGVARKGCIIVYGKAVKLSYY